ncbi:hypothetical protein CHS0354_005156 [Potamilus streckersoni]|nr:hypothetical protein CHS0354_005156 [Potamilus streckersoni]
MARTRCLFCIFLWLVSGRSKALGPPHQEEQVQYHQIAKVGQAKKLLCPVVANPDPIERQWFKDSTAITINHDWTRFRLLKDGSLRIKPVELEDAGQYVCKATNGFGRISMNYTLTVLDKTSPGLVKQENVTNTELAEEDSSMEGVPPRFMQEKMKRQNIVRPVSSSVRLKCRASGKPTPHIQWVKNGVLDMESQQKWTLKLQKLKEDDSGNYTCIVSNRFGIINYTYTLEVVAKITSKPVLMGPHPVNETVPLGGTVSFQCRAKSAVQPHIQWLKKINNLNMLSNDNDTIEVEGQKFIVLKAGKVWNGPDGSYINKLNIPRVSEDDAGMYICLGANSRGYSFRSAFLTIRTTDFASSNGNFPSDPHDKLLKHNNHDHGGLGPTYGSSAETNDNSTNSGFMGNQPQIIAIATCSAFVFLIVVGIFILQRRRCNAQSRLTRNAQFNPVPTHDKDMFSHSGHTNPHMIPIMNANNSCISNSEKVSKNYSMDMYSDISSVSKSHHQPSGQETKHLKSIHGAY